MKCLKKIINFALANEWIEKNPLAGIKFHEKEVVREFLTMDELMTIYQKEFVLPRLALVRDVFIFAAFTGLAFIDVQQLAAEHIVQDNNGHYLIRKTRQKTNNMCDIPLLNIPLAILKKYENHPTCIKRGVLLPVPCNQNMNSYLKEIADVCGTLHLLSLHYKVNSEGNTCEFKPTGFRAKNYHREFFTRKNSPVSPSELRKGSGQRQLAPNSA